MPQTVNPMSGKMQPRHRKVIGIPDKHPIPIHSKSNMVQTQSILFLFCCPNSGKFPYRSQKYKPDSRSRMRSGLSVSVGTFRLRELKKNLCVDNQSPESTHTKGNTATTKNGYLFLRPIMKCGLRSSAPYNREMTVCSSSRDFF